MTTRSRSATALGLALLVASGTAACTAPDGPASTSTSPAAEPSASATLDAGASPGPAAEPTASPDPVPSAAGPSDDRPTSPTVIPYDPGSDYADATPDELRDYVTANDELLEAAIPSFAMQAGTSPEPAVQDLLDRARRTAAAVGPGTDVGDDELRPLLDAQEQILAEMAG